MSFVLRVVTDLRILNAISRRFNLIFSKSFRYCLKGDLNKSIDYNGKKYIIKYFDGCFYPYLIEVSN